jgi:epoxyqueuosine reductase QueG
MHTIFSRHINELDWLQEEIDRTIEQWKEKTGKDYWQKPLVGIASADDPLFAQLKVAVSPDHAMPQELLKEAQSVIVFFLPFKPSLGEENDRETFWAARTWAESYVTTNALIGTINTHLKNVLEEAGYSAFSTPATHNFDETKLISGWSHKHLAYIAGLGTFGFHHLLITQAGCCGRLGSLVTSVALTATARPQQERCLVKAGHRCWACVPKCQYEALHKTHYDRQACYQQLLKNDAYYSDLPLVDVCGKCACEVPCSYGIPSKKD